MGDFFQSKFVTDLVNKNQLPTVNVEVQVNTKTIIELAAAAFAVALAIMLIGKVISALSK
ncbi:hypothetical protein QNI19_16455 [Cytophagaceae bacterium DM2B3-1]|uniref:Uncharacterized protein n=2 Tax=Xanthocytophaga TaxID=3078918 RepID=A0ABT7CLA7_9BACT|nr:MULTISPECIES: hypothetical protein [Xanthocytophaga]MDJ1494538.1 hypothetical protein [Xanthocytophaga flavus]MDJ1505001.1 hypothetical protein [Xanthocytophaga agilis]